MGWSIPVGTVKGTVIRIHVTFLLFLVWIAASHYARGGRDAAIEGTVFVLLLFLCVLLHEFGHVFAARRYGVQTPDITLLPIGGVARLERIPEEPSQELIIALAGPAVNVVIAAVLFVALGGFLPPDSVEVQNPGTSMLARLAMVNLFLVLFNLIPAFPMDGGRVLRGLLATRFGMVRATEISATVGQFFAAAFFLLGLLGGNFLLALIAVFIFFGATGEAQMVRQRELTRGLLISDVMGTRPRLETVTPYHTFGQVLDSVIHGYQEDFPVVDENGKLVGMLTRNEIMTAAHSPERYASVRDLMKSDFPTISPDADLFTDGARILQESDLKALPVVRDGQLVGMLTMEDIGESALLRDIRKLQY
jgi:Zn-dependent protease/CBS domain-containing protein